ncbi:NUDIX hydrolase [Hyphomicrobium sp.]|uniref:NUDIX hydrolase n=1 Tax=Hyphomicrobium sp. TaxID=82 RepID=UPI000F9C3F17|nr:NUDIX hydrolase [Hyphomicrobium sp.]RUO99214.1 MAG: NUDIX hydrolase [Hyphomicrobium sp.]
MSKKSRWQRQVGALPIDIASNGEAYVLLVTSRETKRWVIPKGWPSRKMSDSKAAAREAEQEAGVLGKIERKPIGRYTYRKVLPAGSRMIEVDVYPLWVRKELKKWSEQSERTRIWATFDQAAKLVREPSLQRLFSKIADDLRNHSADEIAETRDQGSK